MAEKKILFVVGAGASKEADLPTGKELKLKISQMLDIRYDEYGTKMISGDHIVWESIRRNDDPKNSSHHSHSDYQHAAWQIRDAMSQVHSIDNFIDMHQGDEKIETCGKLAIVRAILEAERESKLYVDRTRGIDSKPNFDSLEGTWFNEFMKLLVTGCNIKKLPTRLSSIGFVVFNYDRCIEHFLYHSLQNCFGIKDSDAVSLVQSIGIYHPYGTVGNLPWYKGGNHNINFGNEPKASELIKSAKLIKTFTEGTDPNSSDITIIRQKLAESHIVVFLGFAFNDMNLDLLWESRQEASSTRYCWGTAKGISDSDLTLISYKLRELGGFGGLARNHPNVTLRNDLTCFQLFQEYSRSISF